MEDAAIQSLAFHEIQTILSINVEAKPILA
jgi:hypothetical protein